MLNIKHEHLFSSISRPSFITVNDDENIYIASHVLELYNYGPSILPVADLTVRYPQVQLGGRAQLYLNKTTVYFNYHSMSAFIF